ncbi:MAG TPA: hypothetical protein VJH03_22135 [Blastocatellia bacterium]|nr:hypothetical protein [Blastocatellia bacterium]
MIILSTLKKILFWSYERGTWQYDILCVLILAFIFATPNSAFHKQAGLRTGAILISREELGEVRPDQITSAISRYVSRTRGSDMTVTGIDAVTDESGQVVGYRATVK